LTKTAGNTKNTKSEITPFEAELIKAVKKVKEFKLSCEANIVSILWKDYDLLFHHDNIKLEDFNENEWKVYYQIAYDIIVKENKKSLDDITVGLYLEKHPKLKLKYEEYGGYETITKAKEYVKEENIDGYINELKKWNIVLQLLKMKFPVYDELSRFSDMTADQIYDEWEAKINHIFVNVDGNVHTYCITDGIDELIDELDDGFAVGLPYNDMPLINKETGGQLEGNITLIGGLSNVGKTTFIRSVTIPSILKHKERLVIMLNEDGRKKWQREMLIWIANNIYKKDLQKYIVRDGKYSPEVKELLKKCANWLKEQASNHTITLIPFEKYQTSQAIKVIKKYSSMGVKYFLLDTFKMDAGKVSEHSWMEMQQNMVDINDVVKQEAKNVHAGITFQLSKGSARQRYYTQDNIGVAKNIIDPASTCIMIRDLLEDEYKGGKNELKVYRLEGKSGKSKIPVELDRDKHYQVVFIIKNREGSANQYQIVIEHDMSRNILKEVGITHVSVDF
jgi:replicative DNA helicase